MFSELVGSRSWWVCVRGLVPVEMSEFKVLGFWGLLGLDVRVLRCWGLGF